MDDKIKRVLSAPFPAELIKQRKGPNGKNLSYVEIQDYIDKLNTAFDFDWSLELVRREQIEDQIIVEVRLTAGAITKSGLGGATITRRKDTGAIISLADAYKTGEADAIKRACRLLGIGGSLYNGDTAHIEEEDVAGYEPQRTSERSRPAPSQNFSRPASHQEHPREPLPGPGRTRLSGKQLAAISAISRRLGMDAHDLRSHVVHEYGVVPEHLTGVQASALITRMGARASSGNGRDQQYGGNGAREPGEDR